MEIDNYRHHKTLNRIGPKAVIYCRILYEEAFFFAALKDTTILWTLSVITTIPNLIGVLWLRKDMKKTIGEYGDFFEENFSGKDHPKFI